MTEEEIFDLKADGPIHPDYALTMFDKSEPRALINIVWKEFSEILDRAKFIMPDLFKLSERDIKRKTKPDPILDMLRLRFWQEYDRAQLVDQQMRQVDIIRGLCSKEYWYEKICKDPEKLTWILLPLAGYITRMESSLITAQDEIEDILRLPIRQTLHDKHGKKYEVIDSSLIANKIKIWQALDIRVKGAVVQKLAVHQKIDQHVTTSENYQTKDLDNLQAIERLIELKKRQIEAAQSRELIRLPEKTVEDEELAIETE